MTGFQTCALPIYIDNVIQLIRSCNSDGEVIEKLMSVYNLNEAQAEGIAEMKLRRLAKIEKIALENEKKTLMEKMDELQGILDFAPSY